MNRNEKIKLLKDLQTGKINIRDFKRVITGEQPLFAFFIETEPGIYREKDTGQLYDPDTHYPWMIRCRRFNDDGTLIPELARSEKEVYDRLEAEMLHAEKRNNLTPLLK